ncbi:hypothetical protein L195_g020698, partial [Trifolium pratense]
MGCAQSRIDNEESVARCKDRKNLMREAVLARNAFAAGHSGYSMALKNTGAALSDYAHGETHLDDIQLHAPPPLHSSPKPPPPPPPPMEETLPPPPLPPDFSPASLKRSVTLPPVALQHRKSVGGGGIPVVEENGAKNEEDKGLGLGLVHAPPSPPGGKAMPPPPLPDSKNNMAWDYFFMDMNMARASLNEEDEIENEEGEIEGENVDDNGGHVEDEIEPKTPEKVEVDVYNKEHDHEDDDVIREATHIEHSKTAPAEFRRAIKVVPTVTLMQILGSLDDHFLKASETAQQVSKMLEATRLHYHSNFADNRGHIDHSARVMRVITWNRSFKGVSNGEGGKDDFDSEDYETHATVLDKLLAWEKKLYEEVKQGELMKFEYQRKVAILNKQKKRGASVESLGKTKAA